MSGDGMGHGGLELERVALMSILLIEEQLTANRRMEKAIAAVMLQREGGNSKVMVDVWERFREEIEEEEAELRALLDKLAMQAGWSIRGFSARSAPLSALLKHGKRWQCGEMEEGALRAPFEVSSAPVLANVSETDEAVVRTEASLTWLGAVLSQGSGRGESPVASFGRSLKVGEGKSIRQVGELKRGPTIRAAWNVPGVFSGTQRRGGRFVGELKGGPTENAARKVLCVFSSLQMEKGNEREQSVGELKRGPTSAARNVPEVFSGLQTRKMADGRQTGHFICSLAPDVMAASSHSHDRKGVLLRRTVDERWGTVLNTLAEHLSTGSHNSPSLAIGDGFLYKGEEGGEREWKLVVPRSYRVDALRVYRRDESVEHKGKQRGHFREFEEDPTHRSVRELKLRKTFFRCTQQVARRRQ